MSEMGRYFADFISHPYMLLISMGYDILDKRRSLSLKTLMYFYFCMCFICIIYCSYNLAAAIMDEIVAGVPNLPVILRVINDLIYDFIGLLKSFFFARNLNKLKKLLKTFKDIFPKSTQDRNEYRVNDNFWPIWIIALCYIYYAVIVFIQFSPLAQSVLEYMWALLKVGYAEANFTYHKVYEEQTYLMDHHTPLGYIVVYSIEVMNSHYAMVFNIAPDMLLVAFSVQLCMHFDYISRSFENYKPMKDNCEKDSKFLANAVRKHVDMLELSDFLNDSFSSLVLVMLLSTVTAVCSGGVFLLTQGFNRELLGYFGYSATTMAQYYMICYCGQELINKSLEVGNAVYNQTWYNSSKSHKNAIVLIIARAQRQCEINAGGFQTTNLESFKQVLTMTFQLFTVARTMMDPEQ